MSEDKSPLAFEQPVSGATCEERLKAAEVQLMLNKADGQQVRQHQLAYNEALKDITALKARIKALENEVSTLRQAGARNTNAMVEYMELIENLDFRVESAKLRYIIQMNEHFYLRFDRHGRLKHAYAPDEYNKVINSEWDTINSCP